MVKKITISDDESSASEASVTEIKPQEEKKTKPKKILSEKQKEALVKGRERRREKLDEKKLNQKIEASKFLLELDHKKKKEVKPKPEPEDEPERRSNYSRKEEETKEDN
jgi:hypothetical protein